MTSRWKCMVPLGWPVVPEVKAISARSSAAVSMMAKPGLVGHAPVEIGVAAHGIPGTAEIGDALEAGAALFRRLHLLGEGDVAESEADARLLDDEGELARTQKRHGGNADAASLEHAEPGGRHHRVVGSAQQHPVAGNEAELFSQDAGDAVGAVLERRI